MALPGDELTANLRPTDGKIIVSAETSNSCGEKVLQGATDVAQPATVYIFTGQGSQEPGMGTLLGKVQMPICLQFMANLPS